MTTNPNPFVEVPPRPRPGETWLTINLGLIRDMPALFNAVVKLGFDPKLGYRLFNRDTNPIEFHLVLHSSKDEILPGMPDYMQDAVYALSDIIPDTAIHYMQGLRAIAS